MNKSLIKIVFSTIFTFKLKVKSTFILMSESFDENILTKAANPMPVCGSYIIFMNRKVLFISFLHSEPERDDSVMLIWSTAMVNAEKSLTWTMFFYPINIAFSFDSCLCYHQMKTELSTFIHVWDMMNISHQKRFSVKSNLERLKIVQFRGENFQFLKIESKTFHRMTWYGLSKLASGNRAKTNYQLILMPWISVDDYFFDSTSPERDVKWSIKAK